MALAATTRLGSSVYVCLASENLLPNFLPLVAAPAFSRVVIITTAQFEDRVAWFRRALNDDDIAVHQVLAHPYDYQQVRGVVQAIIEKYEEVVVNLTGGTKVMALAAFSACVGHARPIYVDSVGRRIIDLSNSKTALPWPPSITIKPYLACYGYEMVSVGDPKARPAAWLQVARMLAETDPEEGSVKRLNRLASERRQNLRRPMDLDAPDLVDLLQGARLIQAQTSGQWRFADEPSRAFLNGGWLEALTFETVYELMGKPAGTAVMNLNISRDGVPNEFDIAFVHHGRLHVIECKTGDLAQNKANPLAQVVYKLDSLTDQAGGAMARAMFVSYHPLPETMRQRCAQNAIAYCDRLDQLQGSLKQWLASSAGPSAD